MLFAFAYLLLRRVVRLPARSSYDLNTDGWSEGLRSGGGRQSNRQPPA